MAKQNWYKNLKSKKEYNVLNTQLLCCGYPENRREDEYKKKAKPNFPEQSRDKKI